MQNKKRSGIKWLQTWRSLLLISYLSPILFIVFNVHFKSEFHNSSVTTHHWLYRGIAVSNIVLLLLIVNYIFNYRYLVREKIINHTKTRFFLGFLPLVAYSVINILVLIYV